MNKTLISMTCVAAAVVVGFSNSSQAAGVTLVENGEPRVSLVVAADEPKAEQAAAEIQKYLPLDPRHQSTGDFQGLDLLHLGL